MPISVTCPRCASKYQLDASMRGKRMRCPNTICRAVFEARDDADPVPPPAAPVETKAPEPAPPSLTLQAPTEAPPKPSLTLQAPTDDFPGDDSDDAAPAAAAITTEAWQPQAPDEPPVRDEPAFEPIAPPKATPAPVKRQRALWVIAAMILMLGLVAGSAYWRLRSGLATNEAERYQKAEQLYKEQQFADAFEAFQNLHRDFPDSQDSKKYRFLAELSDVRQAVQTRESASETEKSLERVAEFIRAYRGDALLKERETDLWQMLDFLARELTRLAELGRSQKLIDSAKLAWTAAKHYPAPPQISLAERERTLNADWTRIETMLAAQREHRDVVASLKKHIEQASAQAVQDAWALVEKTKRQDDAEIRALLEELRKAHREQVRFVAAESEAKRVLVPDDPYPSLIVAPSAKKGQAAAPGGGPVLALARGVLYALEPTNGEVRWVRRVGIDTRLLPLRVPADAITPELVLALSSDQRSVTALIADTGAVLWQTPLSDACVGQPVLVDRQVLVPTLEGNIDEIEVAEGRLIGSYTVNQPLTLGGVQQPGSPFVYFPADEFCLYVLDVTKRTCTNILYTKHPAGSLRGLPAIVSADKASYLLWCQAGDRQTAEIRPYELPIAQPDQKPIEPILTVGDLSAPPWVDGGRVAATTNSGGLSLWGIRQKGTRDPLFFRLAKRDAGASADFRVDLSNQPSRCEVVHAEADNLWTVMHGRLQRVAIGLDPQQGPTAKPLWTEPIPIGTLLHAVQTRREPTGRTVLYLTTQDERDSACLCSAIAAEDGKVLWQRQLGAMPLQAPVLIDGRIALRDPLGIFMFASNDAAPKGGRHWRLAGDWLLQNQNPLDPATLLTREKTLAQLSWKRGSKELTVRTGSPTGGLIEKIDVPLAATLQGTPALGEGFLLLPLADGIVYRARLAAEPPVSGPRWRASGAEDQAVGHIVLVTATDFVTTDGSRGLARYTSSDASAGKPVGKPVEFLHRITVAPVVLPAADPSKIRLCVADASDTLTLLDAERLNVLRSWSLPGKITAGPFVEGGKIGCVIGKSRLVWIDPDRDGVLWEYAFGEIVGEPHVIAGVLVLADVEGRLVGLDPSSGRPAGAVLTLRANVAATASPLPFGPAHAFVPLTDGTIVLAPIASLRK